MENYNEIRKKIERATATAKAAADYMREQNAAARSFFDVPKMPGESTAEYMRRYKASGIDEKITAAAEQEQAAKMTVKFLENNFRAALAAQVAPVALEIWNKHAGKRYGAKTRDKIYNEIKAATGCYFHISAPDYTESRDTFDLSPIDCYCSAYRVTLCTRYDRDTNTRPQFLVDNVIQRVTVDDIAPGLHPYVDDIPAAIDRARELYKAAYEAQEAAKAACDAYRAAAVEGLPEANVYKPIYHAFTI